LPPCGRKKILGHSKQHRLRQLWLPEKKLYFQPEQEFQEEMQMRVVDPFVVDSNFDVLIKKKN
jgi:flagellar assembly factor FliW